MHQSIRAAVTLTVLCLGVTAGAQDNVQVGKDGSTQVRSGDTRVQTGKDGSVRIKTPNVQVKVPAAGDTGASVDAQAEGGSGRHRDLMGSSQKKTIACQKDTEVSITGSSNTYTFTGECKRISVTGSENKVVAEAVATLDVTGSDNTVTWQRGIGSAKKPKMSSTGTNNSLTQAK